ncbi:MAG TPA: EF-hand domain-containing protein [Rudaea sp.]|nr:EF-hand domain-containing protein [Rudaea sp.]
MKPGQSLAIAALGLLAFAGGAQAQDQVTNLTAANGTRLTVVSGSPKEDHYGPAPAFAKLDTNHDGYVSRAEAAAFPPLLNDFDYAAHHASRISKQHFQAWVKTQYRPGLAKQA